MSSWAYVGLTAPTNPSASEHQVTTPILNFTDSIMRGATNLTDRLLGAWNVALSAPTLDTGEGANELYDMDQNVLTTSDVDFNSIDATEFYWDSEPRSATLSHPSQGASYIIWNDTATNDVYAKNGETGQIDYGGSWDAGGVDGANASAVIQSTIESNRKIVIKNGDYYLPTTILIQNKENIVLEAESWDTKLIPESNNSAIAIGKRTLTKAGGLSSASNYVMVTGFYIDGTNQATVSTAPHDEGAEIGCGIEVNSGCDNIVIEKNYIYNTGSDSIYGNFPENALILVNVVNGTRGYYASIHAHDFIKWVVSYNIIINSDVEGIRHGSIITNNYIDTTTQWGILGSYPGGVIANNHLRNVWRGIESYWNGSIIIGNRLVGDGTADGYGILLSANKEEVTVVGNTLDNFKYGIFYNSNSKNVIVKGNIIKRADYGMWITSGVTNTIIQNNIILQSVNDGIYSSNNQNLTINGNLVDGVTNYDGIRDIGSYNTINNNRFLNISRYSILWDSSANNNIVLGNYFTKPLYNIPTTSILKENIGYVTENSGTQTLSNGSTAVNVTHGCDYTPSAGDIQIHPIESLGSASFFWVEQITSTTFEINVNANPTQDVDFAWSVDRH